MKESRIVKLTFTVLVKKEDASEISGDLDTLFNQSEVHLWDGQVVSSIPSKKECTEDCIAFLLEE